MSALLQFRHLPPLNLIEPIQGVSEFDRQTFRADSMISIKLLIHMG
jgi:hypothetical protein